MFKFKKLSVLIILFIILSPRNLALSKGFDLSEKLFTKSYYENSSFSTQENNVNLIINTISTNRKNILIDSYFLNNSKNKIKTITNFNLKIKDESNTIILDAVFPEIPLEDGLLYLQGKKVILSLPKDKNIPISNLKNVSNIYYEFTYNYTLK